MISGWRSATMSKAKPVRYTLRHSQRCQSILRACQRRPGQIRKGKQYDSCLRLSRAPSLHMHTIFSPLQLSFCFYDQVYNNTSRRTGARVPIFSPLFWSPFSLKKCRRWMMIAIAALQGERGKPARLPRMCARHRPGLQVRQQGRL